MNPFVEALERAEKMLAERSGEIERLKAHQDETAKAWTKLTESQEDEIGQLKVEAQEWRIKCGEYIVEIERLQELLRGVGANRYWEGRWRDVLFERDGLLAALQKIEDGRGILDAQTIARAAIAKVKQD